MSYFTETFESILEFGSSDPFKKINKKMERLEKRAPKDAKKLAKQIKKFDKKTDKITKKYSDRISKLGPYNGDSTNESFDPVYEDLCRMGVIE